MDLLTVPRSQPHTRACSSTCTIFRHALLPQRRTRLAGLVGAAALAAPPSYALSAWSFMGAAGSSEIIDKKDALPGRSSKMKLAAKHYVLVRHKQSTPILPLLGPI